MIINLTRVSCLIFAVCVGAMATRVLSEEGNTLSSRHGVVSRQCVIMAKTAVDWHLNIAGYYPVHVIPAGARNIRVEEIQFSKVIAFGMLVICFISLFFSNYLFTSQLLL